MMTAMLAMSGLNWAILIVATIIAASITKDLNCSNWYILPIIGIIWFGCWIAICILKMLWLLLPLVILVGIILGVLHYSKRIK